MESQTVGDARLRANAIRKGWIKPGDNEDWPLKIRQRDIDRLREQSDDDLPLQERLVAAVMRDVDAPDARIRQFAVKAGLAMKAQNLASRHHDERLEHQERALESRGGLTHAAGVGVDANESGVRIVIPWNGRDPPPPNAIMGSFEDYRKNREQMDDDSVEG